MWLARALKVYRNGPVVMIRSWAPTINATLQPRFHVGLIVPMNHCRLTLVSTWSRLVQTNPFGPTGPFKCSETRKIPFWG